MLHMSWHQCQCSGRFLLIIGAGIQWRSGLFCMQPTDFSTNEPVRSLTVKEPSVHVAVTMHVVPLRDYTHTHRRIRIVSNSICGLVRVSRWDHCYDVIGSRDVISDVTIRLCMATFLQAPNSKLEVLREHIRRAPAWIVAVLPGSGSWSGTDSRIRIVMRIVTKL